MAKVPHSVAQHDAAHQFRRACLVCIAILLGLVTVAMVAPLAGLSLEGTGPALFFFRMQDVGIVPLIVLTLLLAPRLAHEGRRAGSGRVDTLYPVALAILLCLVGWIGHYLVLDGYDLSRDEQMADFDAYVFAHGRLSWPIPQGWRPLAPALNQLFMLPIRAHEAWASAYLPVNAAIRAAIGGIADAALTGPLLVAAGALALWRIALRLWPDSPATRLVVLILFAGSAQIVVTSMTAYAMSAHLGLDLIWLALFLRGGARAHGGAIAIGFLATGLHQPLFHPLFVLPFLDLLRRERRWRLLAVYVTSYAAIGSFWLAWPIWMSGPTSASGSGVGYLDRLLQIIHVFDLKTVWLMALNLLRFATWQHLLLLPLLLCGLGLVRRDPLVRALAIGLALPVIVMAVILPLQGHGWGYRYLHGVLGNACLIAGYGWHRLASNGLDLRRPFGWASAATALLVMPACAYFAHRWVAPYATAVRAMDASTADIVIVENAAVHWGKDLVLNRPDLGNRPVRLLGSALQPQDMAAVCRHGSIGFYDRKKLEPIRRMLGMGDSLISTNEAALEAAAHAAGCTIVEDGPSMRDR